MRFVAAIAIVWLHTPESPALAPYSKVSVFAVPFFTLVAVMLVVRSAARDPDRPFAAYALSRFHRIYVPFLVWTVIYFGFRNLKHLTLSNAPFLQPSPAMLIGGSAHHLWFLPFIFLTCLVVFLLARPMVRTQPRAKVLAAMLLVLGTACGCVSLSLPANLYLLAQAWRALPSVLWGMAIGLVYTPKDRGGSWMAIGAAVYLVSTALFFRWSLPLLENLSGLGILLIALAIPASSAIAGRLASMGSLAFGIYLCHVMFIEGLQAVASRLGHRQELGLDLLVFCAAAGGSTLLTWLASKTVWGRWLMAVM